MHQHVRPTCAVCPRQSFGVQITPHGSPAAPTAAHPTSATVGGGSSLEEPAHARVTEAVGAAHARVPRTEAPISSGAVAHESEAGVSTADSTGTGVVATSASEALRPPVGLCQQFVANAAVAGDQFVWHVDADPASVPGGCPWHQQFGLYANRVRSTVRCKPLRDAAHSALQAALMPQAAPPLPACRPACQGCRSGGPNAASL
jgi:hypothetical protein